jgi:CRP/FNR family transcriptional regulator, cyclic AMP receptor protein
VRVNEVLMWCEGLPRRELATGEQLVTQGEQGTQMFVLEAGSVAVQRDGVALTRVSEPGAFLGEMSVVLDRASGADVIAVEPSTVVVIDQAADALTDSPALLLAVARLLARRLDAVNSYLSDLKRQYADTEGHLGMMDEVLGALMSIRSAPMESGSERMDLPED